MSMNITISMKFIGDHICTLCARPHTEKHGIHMTVHNIEQEINRGGGGHWPRKGVWGCVALKTPFHASPVVLKGPISSKRVSSQDPLLRKFGNFSLYSLNLSQILAHKPSKFGNFQLTSSKFGHFQLTSP